MPQKRLTAKNVATLTATRQIDYFDTAANLPGFGLRVSPTRKAWFLRYRVGAQQRRLVLGTYPPMELAKARTLARRALLTAQATDVDPAAAKRARRSAQTFGELADHYLELHAKAKKRTWREDGRQLRSIVLPKWKNRAAGEIPKADIAALIHDCAARRGGTSANRLHALLSKLFRWAVSTGALDENPMAGLQKPARETSRDRALSDDEIRALWRQLDHASATDETDDDAALTPGLALWLRLRLLTAQRGGSVATMKWADLDLDRKVWEIPAADMKGGKPHVVPLSPAVVDLLRAQRASLDEGALYVLDGSRGRRQRLGVTEAIDLPDFRPHDLRRTAATGMARAGISRFVIARVLGHVDRTVTGIYDRYEYLNEKRVALDTWARRLDEIVTERPAGAVVPFAKA